MSEELVTVNSAVLKVKASGEPISRQRIYRLLKEGRIKGARRDHGVWLIPWPMVVLPKREKEQVYG